MNCLGTPLKIELLLHYHTTSAPHPHADNRCWKEAHEELLEFEVIYFDSEHDCYRTTPFGKAWVQALCQLPPPKQVFVDQLGKVIE